MGVTTTMQWRHQQVWLSPALALLTPLALETSRTVFAADLNSQEQVISITQFSDVKPTDWAYQALSNLIERYGCVAGYPNGTVRGERAMSRYEAAALLNACLDRITEVTDEPKRLMKEFEKELAVLKGRVDGLEAKVGELEATQFSTTTKLRVQATFGAGAYGYHGSFSGVEANSGPGLDGAALRDAFTLNYDVRLNFDTSFSGQDLFRTRLRAGSFGQSAFDGDQYRITKLDRSYESGVGPDVVIVDRLYYSFPVSREWKAVVGARTRNTEMLVIVPSAYRSNLSDFLYGTFGASGVYNKQTGAGAGLVWKQMVNNNAPFWVAAVNVVAKNADEGDPSEGGIMTASGGASFLAQLDGACQGWGVTGAYRHGQCGTTLR
jgi:hypothetical protein